MSNIHSHAPVAAAIPVPYGAQDYDTVDGRIIDKEDSPGPSFDRKDEKAIFQYLLHPSDGYDESGTYWADMPFFKRWAFVNRVEREEASKELKALGAMTKRDPLEPVRAYFRNFVIPGAGLALEGYVLFSIGNVKSLFTAVWPECWSKYEVCQKEWVSAVDYLEICGIIVGQIIVGYIGDSLGRRFGLIQDAVIMLLGLCILVGSWGTSLNGWVICYAWALFIYGIGVGGEYPMTATIGMEGAHGVKPSTRQDRLHRGRTVTSAFLMQGWGQFFNQVILILSLLIFHHGSGNPPYSKVATQWTYRVSFILPAIGTLWLVYYRAYKMPAASKSLNEVKKKQHITGYDVKSFKLTVKYFGPRIIATAGAWFANDVFFYGNKLFQSEFIAVINPNAKGVMMSWLYNLINIGVSLAGYYLASFLIDNKMFGRKNMMMLGFLMDFVLFVIPGFHYKYYTESEHITAFQAMYYLSSFFNQFGPNCVTFLVAAEVFPTQVRATAHGFSAAMGKLGALMASVMYNYITTDQKFHIVPWFGLGGMLVTLMFMPDTTGLDLKEQDRRFQFIREGRENEYHGVAIHSQHLSLWERFRGVGKNYDADADHSQKVDEMRKDWEERQRRKLDESSDNTEVASADPNDDFNADVHTYFEQTSPKIQPLDKRQPMVIDQLNEKI
ncbi:major facilitator superfamily domain-containing protein [Dipodascopsis tothii]|uniref:major facilitator superfamily domain-containing protein n=1 Tax=Dipodascopsis tothii TaxID=44089 RepID=UPI0034CE1687